ncbi:MULTISPECIES: SDR family oxidoreductase [unclassified Mucilaginibacter]|uniref:SDR family oxidoreductase n=1 Tax=unclassified Mucilaginibacter TaxID=2617802 RepID=UPI002AC8EB4D|nr:MULTISPECIES: SDR family oxidoreductase [unclassified Mucilaginibacter]MEB0262747.1 SDR family oxidoreductase [Mucilaginibacter sp. 10I4]MEB0279518.1 SDR family oxidoreductase [Mucilaginibacter sp. 10B2]MEB0302554.1 SDR family oxidoreductase [Mucilaginibacter sp. 5C4]WPX22613.1 SDR family oxidoreductase [Mucilaginibacter sp. 5C4]
MTVSILGCGWYGLALAKALVARGVTVNGSTTSPDKLPIFNEEGINSFLIDLAADHSNYDTEFFTCDVLVIAIPPKARSGAGADYVPKLKNVIKAIDQHGIKKVILISSTGVYADQNHEMNELSDPKPNTPSGQVLFEAEELFKLQKAFKTTIIRFGGLIGPGREPGRFFAGKKDIPNGLAPVNMIHQQDCVGFTLAVMDKDAFGYTMNACTPHHPPKFAFYTQAAAKAGLEAPQFLTELKEWKIIFSVNNDKFLGYEYHIKNWYEWLK